MDFIKKLKLIERIDGMISRKSTGTPAELSQKIGVSERTLYNIIRIMKQLGAPIYYSSSRMSYCYNGTVSFSSVFTVDEELAATVPIANTSEINMNEEREVNNFNPIQRVYHLRSRFEDNGLKQKP